MLESLLGTAYNVVAKLASSIKGDPVRRRGPYQMRPALWGRLVDFSMPEAPQHVVEKGLEPSPFNPSQQIRDTHVLLCVPKGLNTHQLFEFCGKDATFVPSSDHEGAQGTYWCYVALNAYGSGRSQGFVAEQVEAKGCVIPTEVEVFLAILAMQDLNKDPGAAPLFDKETSQTVFARCGHGENVIIGGTPRGFETYRPGIVSAGTAPTIRFKSN